jgi:hypothetical protein
MIIKTVNDSAESDNIISILLVFGVYSRRIKIDSSPLFVIKRVEAIRTIIKKVRHIYAER